MGDWVLAVGNPFDGGSVGVAFDIPAETVWLLIHQLQDRGWITGGWTRDVGSGIVPLAATPNIGNLYNFHHLAAPSVC